MKTIAFQVSKTLEIDPEKYIYATLITAENVYQTTEALESIVANIPAIQMKPFDNYNYSITERREDINAVHIFEVSSKDALKLFTNAIRKIDSICGGILSTEISNEEHRALMLIEELVKEAYDKALKYAQFCGQKLKGIASLKVLEDTRNGWRAYPPLTGMNRQSIYSAILTNFNNNQMFQLTRSIEAVFEMT